MSEFSEIEIKQPDFANVCVMSVSAQGEVSVRCAVCDKEREGSFELGSVIEFSTYHVSCQRSGCGSCVEMKYEDVGIGLPFCPPDEAAEEGSYESFGCEQWDYMEHMMNKD